MSSLNHADTLRLASTKRFQLLIAQVMRYAKSGKKPDDVARYLCDLIEAETCTTYEGILIAQYVEAHVRDIPVIVLTEREI